MPTFSKITHNLKIKIPLHLTFGNSGWIDIHPPWKDGVDFVEKTSISSFRKIDLESYLKVPTVISTNENRWDCAWEGLRVGSPLEYPPWEWGIPDTRVNYYNSPHIHVTDILSRYGLNANNSLLQRLTISYQLDRPRRFTFGEFPTTFEFVEKVNSKVLTWLVLAACCV